MNHGISSFARVVVFMLFSSITNLIAQELQSFRIRAGTIEPLDEPDRIGYVFRSNGEEQMFVARRDEHLTSKSVKLPSPYPPNLQPIGFKLGNGVEYLYQTSAGLRSELATAQAAAKEHPESKVVARLFQGEAGSRLELALAGPTPVFRTDLKINGRDITLWSNRKPDVPAK